MEFEFVGPDRPSKCTWNPNAKNNPHHTPSSIQSNWKNTMPNILHAVGQTPMVKLNNIPKKYDIACEIFAKCEFMNPGGSMKNRIASRMIEAAERSGRLKPGYTIIEASSGNTGIAVAMVAAAKGYPCIIVMSEKYSDEKLYTMQALGAKIIRTPIEAAQNNSEGPLATAQRLHRQMPGSIILNQFINPENSLVHYHETAMEIWKQCDGKVDYIVGGLGSGGTLTGVGRKFRELSPITKIIVADPKKPRDIKYLDPEDQSHNIDGIGNHFVATVTDLNVIDMHVKVEEKECFRLARELVREEGLLCGASSGASLAAALIIAKNLPADKRVVIILADTIRNYLTKFVSDSWMETKGFLDPPKPLKTNEWWWNLPVSELYLKKPIILPSDCTCDTALKFLQEKSIREAPMSDNEGGIKGFVTLEKLLSCLISAEMKNSDLAIKTLVRQYKRVNKSTELGRLSRILQHLLYVAVFDEDNNNAFVGVLTQNDLYSFIFHG